MNDRLEAKEGNIICPGYGNHKPRILPAGEVFDLTDSGDAVCTQCKATWALEWRTAFYPQED